MQKFNPMQYLAISIANAKGLDKLSWNERIQWVKDNINNLEQLEPEDSDKFLYRKGVKALRDTQANKEVSYVMDLDGVNSGAQIMSVLAKCKRTAKSCSVIGSERADLYTSILNKIEGVSLTRKEIKEATIPALYGSIAEPRNLLGEDTKEYLAFEAALGSAVPSLMQLRVLFSALWSSNKDVHTWTLPDGHTAYCPVLVDVEKKLSTVWWNGDDSIKTESRFNYKEMGYSENSIPLLVNYIHSYDGYVAREMVRRANAQGFELAHIHDSFWAQPKWFNHIRWNYISILTELAQSDHLNRNIQEIKPEFVEKYGPIKFDKDSLDMWKSVMDAEYPLS